jgi:hypothetical protein
MTTHSHKEKHIIEAPLHEGRHVFEKLGAMGEI